MAKGQQQSEVSTSGGEGGKSVPTITINGQQYQIVSPSSIAGTVEGLQTLASASSSHSSSGSGGSVVQYAATSQNGLKARQASQNIRFTADMAHSSNAPDFAMQWPE